MNLKGLFKSPQNDLEKGGRRIAESAVDESIYTPCPKCTSPLEISELWERHNVCHICGHHIRLSPRERMADIADSFCELFENMTSCDPLSFPGYGAKIKNARLASREKEAVLCAVASIMGEKAAVFVMNSQFMMGSMGTVAGEKITLLFEYACEHSLPIVGFTVSGGARMQEGIFSLMQMAKISAAVKKHSNAGLLYITVLTDPTTGGVTASFAMDGDIIIAEPAATIGFAGARVIEQTIRKKLPAGFQKSEFLLDHGFVDMILPRDKQKQVIHTILKMHSGKENTA